MIYIRSFFLFKLDFTSIDKIKVCWGQKYSKSSEPLPWTMKELIRNRVKCMTENVCLKISTKIRNV